MESSIQVLFVDSESREVYLNGRELKPQRSQKVINHSPDGFNWGYGGSGPAQLALALLLEFTDKKMALDLYQSFKFDVIARIPQGGRSRVEVDIPRYIKSFGAKGEVHYKLISHEKSEEAPAHCGEEVRHICSKGWAARCARSKDKTCRCKCGGHNHGKQKPML